MYIALGGPCVFFVVQLAFVAVYLFQGNNLPLPLGTTWSLPALYGGILLLVAILVMPIGAVIRGIYHAKTERFISRSGISSLASLPRLRTGETMGWTQVLAAGDGDLHLARPRYVILNGAMKLIGALLCAAFAAWILFQVITGNASGRYTQASVMIGGLIAGVLTMLSAECLQWMATAEGLGRLSAELVRLCFFRSFIEIQTADLSHFELKRGVLRIVGLSGKALSDSHEKGTVCSIPLLRAGHGSLARLRSQRTIQSLISVLNVTDAVRFEMTDRDRTIKHSISQDAVNSDAGSRLSV